MFLIKDWLSVELCRENPDAIVVYGDNLIHKGKVGQAIIRDEKNSFGIPTKRLPSMSDKAFFSDREDEVGVVIDSLDILKQYSNNGKTVILPSNKIGSGLAKLKTKSPVVYKLINDFYKEIEKENIK
jgi:hypothetical protein